MRVTGLGVEAVVEGCHSLEVFDVSQCKNLARWLEDGGVERCRYGWAGLMGVPVPPGGRGAKELRFEVVAGELASTGLGGGDWEVQMRRGSARL